jgi:hypothetical protein
MTLFLLLFAACSSSPPAVAGEPPRKAVEQVLDRFHQAAAKADGDTYFSLFAPEGIFIGTDATERWTVEEFRKYAMPHFSKGKGWTYVPKTRHVDLAPGSEVAWFDEILASESYGTCRGSGVLRKVSGEWKVSQYHLTIPVPNELAAAVVKRIREAGGKR